MACGLSALCFGAVTLLALTGLSFAMDASGMPPLPDSAVRDLVMLTGIVWLPLAIGAVLPTVVDVLRERLGRIAASRQAAELAPYQKAQPRTR